MIGHRSDALFEEMAYIAMGFHWPHDQVMGLTHHERRRWVRELTRHAEAAASEGQQPWP